MGQNSIKWTPQQQRAIEQHHSDVLVTASAGTGKTAVLSGSCVDVVKRSRLCPDVWSILVLTFTDMAAEQMRRRIAQQLILALEQTRDAALRQHLRHQLILLGAADISTIHSFCKRIITEHFYQLGLDPAFGIIDADEARLLKMEILDKTIDWAWRQNDIAEPLRQLLTRRDLRTSDGFLAGVIEISDFLDAVVSRRDWFSRAEILAEAADPFATDLAETQKQVIENRLQRALHRIEHATKIYEAAKPDSDLAAKYKKDYVIPVSRLLKKLRASPWDDAAKAIMDFKKPTVYSPKDIAPDLSALIAETVRTALDEVRQLKNLAILNPDYLGRLAGAVSRQTMVLTKLVSRFDRLYSDAKKAINCLDFADLEHYALQLLTDQQAASDKLEPSKTALALRQKYKYIFVDEYQDINAVQQAILDMLSAGGNVFAVGDVKQSIYQWRGARPEIFLRRLGHASSQPTTAEVGLRVDLNVNFRSVKPILDFVNVVFGRIMTAPFAGIDYDESAHLRPAPQSTPCEPGGTRSVVELHILDKPQGAVGQDDEPGEESDASAPGFGGRQLQAAMIAQRIRQMVGADTGKPEFEVRDRQTSRNRNVEYRDIVILMRSLAGRSDFLEVLRLGGIPVSCEGIAGYFEATEITDMLCLLKVLDNPRRDIELAAVLRSPFFNLTDTELAKVCLRSRKADRPCDFYDSAIGFCESNEEPALGARLRNVFEQLENWRTIARRGRLAELVWQVYRRTGYLSLVCALPGGQTRKANLLKLHDRAIQFEGFASSSGVPSLRRFIEFIEKLVAAGHDWSPAQPDAAAGNAVRILSVHKSKGLEFPVVFVADLDSPFNKTGSRRDCLVDEQLTLGLRVIDAPSNSRLDSIGYQVIEEHARQKTLAEEMRILYVAMTRAINRLVLVGCKDKKNCQNILTAGSFFNDQPIPDWHLATCRSHLDWILCALSNHPLLHRAFQTAMCVDAKNEDLFSVQLHDQPQLARLSDLIQGARLKTKNQELKPLPGARDLPRLKHSLNWRYAFGDAPLLPAKRSVSQVTHRNDEFVRLDYSRTLGRMPRTIAAAKQTEFIDGRQIGTATHLVISQIDLTQSLTPDTVARLMDKLVIDGSITEAVVSQIDVASIIGFFETGLGRMVFDKNNVVYREWPFTFSVPAAQWVDLDRRTSSSELNTQDYIIIQGIIDMLITTPNGLLVVDFKTDEVTARQAKQRAELYRGQLELYARAASAIIGKELLGRWLYFLRPGCPVEI